MNSIYSVENGFVSHPLIRTESIESREYQLQISSSSSQESSLIALPTAAGKTVIAAMIAAERLNTTHGKILFLAPFKSLVTQQAIEFNRTLEIPEDEIVELTGDIRPSDREEIWNSKENQIIFATPQVVENDILSGKLDLSDIIHIFFDECHRTKGNSSYSFIAEQYLDYQDQSDDYLVTGMSASPGSSEDEILQICQQLGVTNVEIMSEDDDMLAEHLYTPDITERKIELDDKIREMRDLLQKECQERYKELKELDYLDSARKTLSFGELNAARGKIQSDLDSGESDAYEAISIHAEAMKLYHAVEIIDTQGVNSLESYLESQFAEANDSDSSKAIKRMCRRESVTKAYNLAQEYDKVHPKKSVLRAELIDTVTSDGKMILFTEYTDTAEDLKQFINSHDGISAEKFIGQQEMSRKEQQNVLDDFREGQFDVLVATSVGEEGLDIPSASTVIFFEPVSSGLRSIQRRGRTARKGKGDVIIFIGKGTRDEGKYYASKNKEDTMKKELSKLSNSEDSIQELISDKLEIEDEQEDSESQEQQELTEFSSESDDSDSTDMGAIEMDSDSEEVVVISDNRETKSTVTAELFNDEEVDLQVENNLEVADYVIGSDVAVERKTADDLVSTLTGDRDVFEQIGNIEATYGRAILLVETKSVGELYSKGVHPNAIRGVLDAISSGYNADVFFTEGEEDTARWIKLLAKRSQDDSKTEVHAHGKKETSTPQEQVEYIVSSIDAIGPVNARRLLNHFGTVENIFTATVDELTEVEGIGEKTATKIKDIMTYSYTT